MNQTSHLTLIGGIDSIGLPSSEEERWRLLALMAETGCLDSACEIVELGWARAPWQDGTILIQACKNGWEDVAMALMEASDLGARDSKSRMALPWAIERGQIEAASWMIANMSPAQINARDVEGTTALMIAADQGAVEVARALIHAGAAPKIQDADGWTALARAMASRAARSDARAAEMVSLAMWDGALDQRDKQGRGPLEIAAASGNGELCERVMDRASSASLRSFAERVGRGSDSARSKALRLLAMREERAEVALSLGERSLAGREALRI